MNEARAKGLEVRSLAVINPGNPTGQCLDASVIRATLKFCAENDLVALADEVYQDNVYIASKPFVSYRRVLKELMKEDPVKYGKVALASFHSTSKGIIGECGKRGGYVELLNFDPGVKAELVKLCSISLCPNVLGQITMGLMVNPPRPGDASFAQYERERTAIYESLRRRAMTVVATFNKMQGVSCNPSEGAMYAFPSITLPPKAVAAAKAAGMAPDFLYCLELLDNAGICVVPGSGFGQRPGSFHFRTTFLPQEDKLVPVLKDMEKFHSNFMAKYA